MTGRLFAVLIAALIMSSLQSCAHLVLSEKALGVQVHTQMSNLLDGCDNRGRVSSQADRIGGPMRYQLDAELKLREAAADLGGDTVVILNTDETFDYVFLQGVSFLCYGKFGKPANQ